jgi:hypothetical protein
VATVANWAANYFVAATFLSAARLLGTAGIFWLYAAMGILTWSFVRRMVPETKGKTLEEVQELFAERRTRTLRGSGAADAPAAPMGGWRPRRNE